ncbi:hypothetical protein AX14_013599 [Amanita brunnescens Koide BX004]|nr:hypothetical protein AX14_013599 [Amanita brunnescens Koide BX004]
MLVAPIQGSKMSDTALLQEGNFGQSYIVASPPSSYEPGTVLNYQSPEARFEGRVGLEADIWALGCACFALFKSFLGSDILKQMWFEADGQAKSEQDQERAGVLLKVHRSSIRAKLLEIGEQDAPPPEDEGPMIERPGMRLHEEKRREFAYRMSPGIRGSPEVLIHFGMLKEQSRKVAAGTPTRAGGFYLPLAKGLRASKRLCWAVAVHSMPELDGAVGGGDLLERCINASGFAFALLDSPCFVQRISCHGTGSIVAPPSLIANIIPKSFRAIVTK